MKAFIYTVIGIVILAVIAGFFVIGSPNEERLRRLDGQRVSDLQFIQSEILNYWINKGSLPAGLSELRDDLRGITIPKDPETGMEYGYTVQGPLTFSLCAEFARPSEGAPGFPKGMHAPRLPEFGGIAQNWQHDAGLTCFERTIDEDFYKPIQR